jgi:outer membrane protein OmpA-like peptidoglycan-associated protein
MTIKTALFTFGLSLALALPISPAPSNAQTAEEVKRLLTTLTPRHRQDAPKIIIVRRPVEIVVDRTTVVVDYGYTADIEVQFEFDSARLTRAARASLAVLGRALESGELQDFDYLIAGHTDAKGSAAYNRALSYDRARAVRDYLIDRFDINPRRLHVIGWGESRLKNPRKPFAAVNRRVEVTLIVPEEISSKAMPQPDNSTGIKITPRAGSEQLDDFTDDAGEQDQLPECPTGRPGDPRDPNADIDDFGPRPGIDCMPPKGSKVSISPEGEVIIDW